MKTTAKAKSTLFFSAFFLMTQAAISVALAFMLQRIVDSAMGGHMRDFVFFLVLTFCVWPLDIASAILGAKFRVANIKEMLQLVKQNRLNFILSTKVSPKEEDKELSFFTVDIDVLHQSYYGLRLSLFHQIPLFLFSLASLFFINWMLTLVVGAVSLLPMITTWIFGKPLAKRKKIYSDSQAVYVDSVKEIIDGKKEIVSYGKQGVFVGRHKKANESVENARARSGFLGDLAGSLSFNIGFLVQFAGIGLGSYLVITGDLTIGFLIATMQLVGNLVWPVVHGAEIMNAMKASEHIRSKAMETPKIESQKPIILNNFVDSIEISDLAIKYDDGNYIFKNMNLRFEKGKKYAIKAPSGFGKSSMAKVLALEVTDYEGSVKIDGKDIRNIDPASLNGILRFVRQDPYIFNDTAYENITFFSDTHEKKVIDDVINTTRIKNFLTNDEELNRGISNNSGLSGGQKQSLVLARAMLHNPQILILDEITSNIDLAAACDILENLFKDDDLTCIVITHENDERFKALFDEVIALSKD
ncbi:MAG: ABC transporter ATP-binding protein/permease [Defluviitaleaceae bacterium]|nr:ABC transporter ATP-binding protein/permease [Defluviitaleaceae bacterium]